MHSHYSHSPSCWISFEHQEIMLTSTYYVLFWLWRSIDIYIYAFVIYILDCLSMHIVQTNHLAQQLRHDKLCAYRRGEGYSTAWLTLLYFWRKWIRRVSTLLGMVDDFLTLWCYSCFNDIYISSICFPNPESECVCSQWLEHW